MAVDVDKLEDHLIRLCHTADDAKGVLRFFAGIRDILNADCKCETAKVENRTVPFTCYPCSLRVARDWED